MVGTAEDGEAGREGGIGIHLWKDECAECLSRQLVLSREGFQFFPRSIFVG